MVSFDGLVFVGRENANGGSACAGALANEDNSQALLNLALDQFAIPGDASFPLNQAFEAAKDRQDAETLRQ